MIARLLALATGRPRRVLLSGGAVFAVAALLGAPVTGMLGSGGKDFQDPASEYERTDRAISATTGQSAEYEVAVMLRAPRPIPGDPAALGASAALERALAGKAGFQRALAYSASRSRALLSRDRHETVLLAAFATPAQATKAILALQGEAKRAPLAGELAGMRVRFGGSALFTSELNGRTLSDLTRAELLALPLLLLLSFWFFRGLVAALLPPLVGGLAILLAFLGLRIVDHFTPVSVFALNLVSGMGLGLGLDYSLFVLYRFREELAGGASAHRAIERTLQTVGRTVLFSSLTVAAAMMSLLLFPLRFLYSMGIGGALVALCDGAVVLLLLPALLILLGPRINALSPAWLQRRAGRSARAREEGAWWRLASGVVRRPIPVALLSASILLAAAIPALKLHFTAPGANLLPASAESRQVEGELASDFPANAGEATEIVLRGSSAAAHRLAARAAKVAGPLAALAAPVALNRDTWEITLLPHGSPYSSSQQRLLSALRRVAHPSGALVGGASAFFADQRSAIAAHVPLVLLILLSLTAIFLFLMTGSALIPIKALLMNGLSISVAVGLQVLIFQDGHLAAPLGFTPLGGLEESSLVLMLVLAFALATDYEVFVLGRIKEAHDAGLPDDQAIALGIERTGRIVTAAALLFCVAIGALVTSNLFFTKQLGLGAALAVAVDASVIRALLVPSLMALMGRWNWWAPAPLRRLHERLGRRGALARAAASEPAHAESTL